MKRFAIIAIASVMLSSVAFAQQPVTSAAPSTQSMPMLDVQPVIPAMQGTTLITEVNMSDRDILGMVKQGLTGFAQGAEGAKGDVGEALKAMDLNQFVEAIDGVKAVRVMQFKLVPGTKAAQVLGFYEQQFAPTDGWTRILYDTSMVPKTVIAAYTRGGQEFMIIGVTPTKNRLYIARTVGTVDVPKLANWAGKVAKYGAEEEAKHAPHKPVKKTPAKKKALRKK